jgi:hypothetical protein
MGSRSGGDEGILGARVSVPEHVVYREFAEETVILNLQSGMYHGLNQTAARMLEVIRSTPTVGGAIDELASEFEQPPETIRRDVVTLCQALADRGLIEQHAGHQD